MRKFALLAFLSWLWVVPAAAQLVTPVQMRDANLTTTAQQNLITTLNTFSAPRTLTIPDPSALNAYYIQFADTNSSISAINTLTIRVDGGRLINGASTLVLAGAADYVIFIPSSSGYLASIVHGGGTTDTPGGAIGDIQYNNSGAFGGFTASGDFTINTATGVGTLAVVNANVGAFGSNVQCTSLTVNAKGLITAASQTPCTPPITAVTGLGTGVGTALQVAVGSAGAPVLYNGAGGTPSSLTLTNATGLPLAGIAAIAADTLLMNATGGSASPTAVTPGSCSTASSALTYNTTTHAFGCNTIAGTSAANPTATASDTAVNGVAVTFMRSDAAPAVQKASNAQFGVMEGDNVTVTCTTGVCGQKATVLTNSLSGDVALSNVGNYFDGPSTAQGTSGTWWADGTVTLIDTGGAAGMYCRLWDGTNVISSGSLSTNGASSLATMSLHGYQASPAGNIRISCRDISATTGKIIFNQTGNSKDSTLSVHRIQ